MNGDNMKISARNVVKGKVETIAEGAIMSNVKVKVDEPGVLTAIITKEAVQELEIKEGEEVYLIIKSTEVMVAKK
jgi:molybdopterin-binding protein